MRGKVLEIVDKNVAMVDGTVLAVVRCPFYRNLPRFSVVYLAKHLPSGEARSLDISIDKDRIIAYSELDEWMSAFVSCKNWSLWPIIGKGVVDVLYREKQFGELALYATTRCISLRFFEDSMHHVHDIEKVLHRMNASMLSVKDTVDTIRPLVIDLATAIHFARTNDIETDYLILKQHFQVDDSHNLIEISKEYPENVYQWQKEITEKMEDLTAELQGALLCSKIDWEADLELLIKLGQLTMELRQLA